MKIEKITGAKVPSKGKFLVELRRKAKNSFKRVSIVREYPEDEQFSICAREKHTFCGGHDASTIVLRKRSRISSINFYPSIKKLVVYIETPETEEL